MICRVYAFVTYQTLGLLNRTHKTSILTFPNERILRLVDDWGRGGRVIHVTVLVYTIFLLVRIRGISKLYILSPVRGR